MFAAAHDLRRSRSGRTHAGVPVFDCFMIDIKAKIHDSFAVEFKVGFVADGERGSDFAINTWIFLPNSLDINPATYGKEDFYRDVKSNVRFITPVFPLGAVAAGDAVPLRHLRRALSALAAGPSRERAADYEYHIKMYSAIVKSAMREAVYAVEDGEVAQVAAERCERFAEDVRCVVGAYREARQLIEVPAVSEELRHMYSFGDEYMSHLAESFSFRILERLERFRGASGTDEAACRVRALLRDEAAYRRSRGYVSVTPDDPQGNRRLVYRHNVLKKYVSSDLYIKLDKKQDGKAVRQIYYSIAAGIAMVFATVVAFVFQRRFGNFSGPLFVALVVSYMLKDRIKDLTRYYFAHRLGSRYFDNKADINIKEQPVGWLKEGMDFITDGRVPPEVLELRGRTPLLEAENRIFDEKIILYRKLVYIDGQELARYDEYRLSGINDILRLHLNRFTLKMDDPQTPLHRLRDDGSVEVVYTDRIYYINFVMQFRYGGSVEYKRFRLVVTRNGILGIEEMN